MSSSIFYKKSYKYQLYKDYSIKTDIKPNKIVSDNFITLNDDGLLLISLGYAWDGPSGPVIDTKHNLKASLVHDVFYQLLRNETWTLNESKMIRKKADILFREICIKDGVFRLTSYIYYWGLRIGAGFAAEPHNKKHVLQAPK